MCVCPPPRSILSYRQRVFLLFRAVLVLFSSLACSRASERGKIVKSPVKIYGRSPNEKVPLASVICAKKPWKRRSFVRSFYPVFLLSRLFLPRTRLFALRPSITTAIFSLYVNSHSRTHTHSQPPVDNIMTFPRFRLQIFPLKTRHQAL